MQPAQYVGRQLLRVLSGAYTCSNAAAVTGLRCLSTVCSEGRCADWEACKRLPSGFMRVALHTIYMRKYTKA